MRGVGWLMIVVALAAGAAEPPAVPAFTASQLHEDLVALDGIIAEMHPAPSYTVNARQLAAARKAVVETLESGGPLNRDEAWRLFATLNPAFADGHLLVGIPDWRGHSREHLAAGGTLFPYEVTVSVRGDITVLAALGGAAHPLAGKRLRSINGVESREVTRTLLARVPGDTPGLRAGILSTRFWLYYWKVYGAATRFDIQLAGTSGTREVRGASALPAVLADEDAFERMYGFTMLPHDAAWLSVGSFVWEDKSRFLAFTEGAFRKMRDVGTKTLIIDIRANTGGNDDLWRDGILPYIATKPYRWASRFLKRVGTPDPAKNEKVGDIVEGELETWVQPLDHPLRFDGKVYVLLGPSTYSSSVVFSVVMQDFGFGTLVSEGARRTVRASQTGGTRVRTLPHTGLAVIAPRFVLYRPSGILEPELLVADHELDPDPVHPRAAIDRILELARKERRTTH